MNIFLAGHITADQRPDGKEVLGGPVSFIGAALAPYHHVSIATIATPDTPLLQDLTRMGIYVVNLGRDGEETTTFRNVYQSDGRVQFVDGVARAFNLDDITTLRDMAWGQNVVMMCPVANEVPAEIYREIALPNRNIISPIQGSLREWGSDRRVYSGMLDAKHLQSLAGCKMLTLSTEDIAGLSNTNRDRILHDTAPTVLVTDGEHGSMIYHQNEQPERVPAFHLTDDEDTLGYHTGNGDYITAMMVCYLQLGLMSQSRDEQDLRYFQNVRESVARASVDTALKIMPKVGGYDGLGSIPTRDFTLQWQAENRGRLQAYADQVGLPPDIFFDPETSFHGPEKR